MLIFQNQNYKTFSLGKNIFTLGSRSGDHSASLGLFAVGKHSDLGFCCYFRQCRSSLPEVSHAEHLSVSACFAC